VQVGNEITGGTLWPDAQVLVPHSDVKVMDGDVRVIKPPDPYDDAKQWDHLTRIIKAGVRGVRSVAPATTRIMIHIDCGGDWPVTKWYFDHLDAAGVEFDMIGQSYYPRWHGTLENVCENLRETANRYHKDIVIVETAYPWKGADYWAARKNMAWPISPDGQRQFLAELIQAVKETPDAHGAGVMYWNPESIAARGPSTRPTSRPTGSGAMSLFDDSGDALPAINLPAQ
jgi:arabinogalactan endo-1,4-beta-galactosidase